MINEPISANILIKERTERIDFHKKQLINELFKNMYEINNASNTDKLTILIFKKLRKNGNEKCNAIFSINLFRKRNLRLGIQ